MLSVRDVDRIVGNSRGLLPAVLLLCVLAVLCEELPAKSPQAGASAATAQPPAPVGFTGSLRGRFVFQGTPPERKKFAVDKDHQALEGQALFDESLIVGESGGLANVFVWLWDADVPVPRVAEPATPATLRIKNLRYDPHVLAMTSTQKLLIVNDDPVGTSPIFSPQVNPPTNPLLPRGSRSEHQFHQAERVPMIVTASVHPWLKAYLLVRDDPYFAITDEEGRFKISHLPPGDWTFQFWHEGAGYLKRKTGWPKGRLGVMIGEEASDIGVIKLTAEDIGLNEEQTKAAPAEAEAGARENANCFATRRIPRLVALRPASRRPKSSSVTRVIWPGMLR